MNKFSTCSHQEEIKPVHMAKGPSMTGLPRVEMKSTWLMEREKKNTSEVEKDISMFKKPDGPTIAFLVRFALLNRLSIGPILNRLNRRDQ